MTRSKDPALRDREALDALAGVEGGWVSQIAASWEAAGEDLDFRRRVRHTLGALIRADVLSRLEVRHRDIPMVCLYMDPDALAAYIAGLDAEDAAGAA